MYYKFEHLDNSVTGICKKNIFLFKIVFFGDANQNSLLFESIAHLNSQIIIINHKRQ